MTGYQKRRGQTETVAQIQETPFSSVIAIASVNNILQLFLCTLFFHQLYMSDEAIWANFGGVTLAWAATELITVMILWLVDILMESRYKTCY